MDRPKTPGLNRPKTPGFERSHTPYGRPKTPGTVETPPVQYFQVYLRLRPSSQQSSVSDSRFISAIPGQSTSICVTPPDRARTRTIDKYTFTKVFDESAKQLEVFQETVLPLVQDAINGRDGMMATLGVTGSGKTHTILGNKEQRGMVQLALDIIFRSLDSKMVDYSRMDIVAFDHTDAVVLDWEQFFGRLNSALEQGNVSASKRPTMASSTPAVPDASDIVVETDPRSGYAILISMYELYNDRIFDLLDETPLVNPLARRKALLFKKPSAQSQWDSARDQKKVVSGLRKVCVSSYSEALQVVEHAQTCRKVSATNLNLASSRSHAFLQIEMKRFSSRGVERGSSSLHIVDLAGSERSRNAQTAGSQLAEAGSINRSLMTLGQCLASLHQQNSAANWRSSKLTEVLFSNTFSGVSKQNAVMLVTADPMGEFNSTLQILRYSALAKEVTMPIHSASSLRSASVMSGGGADLFSDAETDSSTSGGDGKDALIVRLRTQLEETESRWRDAEDRCLMIEQSVREEMAEEMDRRMEEVRREALDTRVKEAEWRDEFVDEKLEILRKGMEEELKVYEDPEEARDAARRISVLETENEALRREIATLKRERQNRSPTKMGNRFSTELKIGRILGGIENTS
ncbi:P-loop containing nucleoside triphosphate hydrolase protein [Sphaerosporella brunnea]|uniref:Kinesin-like protein n=1 Tax=Sphaerosporella brunnea TaxID=1250544 RepID=A0A5J5EKA0_9PEZI|nr:P-loop containing nucleoside triphosphate hydrolase protein [Sphaerosporella brunnea]